LLKSVIANLPTFVGLVVAVVILREQNNRLLAMLERLLARCEDEIGDGDQPKP